MATRFDDDIIFTGAVTLTPKTGAVQTQFLPKRFVSAAITSLTGGQASQAKAVSGLPAAIIPIAAYVIQTGTITSSNGSTTGLTVSLGVSGSTSGYLAAGANLIAAGGRKENAAGTLLGSYRAADSLLATFTATGGSADLAHIVGLSMRVVVYYLEVATEA